MPLTLLASKALESRIYSVGVQSAPLGIHKSTMELYSHSGEHFIEWAIPTADYVTNIGLTIVNNTLEDYDGIYSLPKPAVELLKEAGFVVPEEFTV
jgi:hypothetical protein